MKNKSFIVLLLVISLLASMMVSCSKDDKSSEKEGKESTDDVSVAESSADETTDDVTDDTTDDASGDKKEDSDVSADTSVSTDDNSSLDSSEDASSDDTSNDADISGLFDFPEEYMGKKTGEWMESVFNLEKGFEIIISEESKTDYKDTIRIAAKGQNFLIDSCSYFEDEAYEEIVILKDGIVYSLDTEEKTYMAIGDFEDLLLDGLFDFGYTVKFLKTEEKEKDGVKYTVEVFKCKDDDYDEEFTEEYYFLGDDLVWMFDGETFNKVEYSKSGISDDAFNIPEGYEELKQPGVEDILCVSEEFRNLAVGKALSKFNSKDGYVIYQVSEYETDYDFETTKNQYIQTLYVKGDKLCAEVIDKEWDESGDLLYESKGSIIIKDGMYYELSYDDKSYYEEKISIIHGMMFDGLSLLGSDYKYIRTETKVVDGKNYTVDIFEQGDDSLWVSEIEFYTLDGELKYVGEDDIMTEVKIVGGENFDEKVFEIPSDFVFMGNRWDDLFGDESFDDDIEFGDEFFEDNITFEEDLMF